MTEIEQGRLLIVTGPSGVGKDAVCESPTRYWKKEGVGKTRIVFDGI